VYTQANVHVSPALTFFIFVVFSAAAASENTTVRVFETVLNKVNPVAAKSSASVWLRLAMLSPKTLPLALPLLRCNPEIATHVIGQTTLLAVAICHAQIPIIMWYSRHKPGLFGQATPWEGVLPLFMVIGTVPEMVPFALQAAPEAAAVRYTGPVSSTFRTGDYAIHSAVREGVQGDGLVELARASGHVVNADNDTPLELALRIKATNRALRTLVDNAPAETWQHVGNSGATVTQLAIEHGNSYAIEELLRRQPAVASKKRRWDADVPNGAIYPLTFAALAVVGKIPDVDGITAGVISRLACMFPAAISELCGFREHFSRWWAVDDERHATIDSLIALRNGNEWIPRFQQHIRYWTTVTHRRCTRQAQEVATTVLTIGSRKLAGCPRMGMDQWYLILGMIPRHELAPA
jgi:hypothetical protein